MIRLPEPMQAARLRVTIDRTRAVANISTVQLYHAE